MEIAIAILMGVFILATGLLCLWQTGKDNRLLKKQIHEKKGDHHS